MSPLRQPKPQGFHHARWRRPAAFYLVPKRPEQTIEELEHEPDSELEYCRALHRRPHCKGCGTRLNLYNRGDYCGPCARRLREKESQG